MSRTNRGSKPQGHDMWGKRPCAGQGNSSKKTCRRIERQQGKQVVCEEVVEAVEATLYCNIPTSQEDEMDNYYIGIWEEYSGSQKV